MKSAADEIDTGLFQQINSVQNTLAAINATAIALTTDQLVSYAVTGSLGIDLQNAIANLYDSSSVSKVLTFKTDLLKKTISEK